MFLISLLLIWLPFFGPLIAGFVGGKKAGGVGSGVTAFLIVALVAIGPLLVGAIVGGALA